MGLLDKLVDKAERMANKLAAQAAQAQQAQGSGQQQGYAPPAVYQQPQFSTPPVSPRPYDPQYLSGEPPRAGTPPAQSQYLAPTTYSPNPNGPQQGRKKAVLVGVSYQGTSAHLRGTINDVQCMRHCLIKW
jgi:hypothetical protein